MTPALPPGDTCSVLYAPDMEHANVANANAKKLPMENTREIIATVLYGYKRERKAFLRLTV